MLALSKYKLPLLLGVLLGIAAMVILREPVRPLSKATLLAAVSRWESRGPQDYSMVVQVTGVQNAVYQISVSNGVVKKMQTDGEDVAPHVLSFWTVPGLFEFLEQELIQCPDGKEGCFIHAKFDEELGYPKRFFRQVVGKNIDIEWNVSEFK